MAITPKDITDLAPEFAGKDDVSLQVYIDLAALWISPSRWGTRYDAGHKLLVAHLLTVAGREGASGAVTMEKVGDISRSYSVGNQTDGDLGTTSWGSLYLRMRRSLITTPMVI